MSEVLFPRPELPEWLENLYAELDSEITTLIAELEATGFTLYKDNTLAQSYILKTSDEDELKVIIYSVGGHFLGRGGISVQELHATSVMSQVKFDSFNYQYANICRRVMGVVRASLPA